MTAAGEEWDAVVLGAGAAGLMAAAEAGRRGRRVLVLEAGESVGRKILISGGGRCNFTNTGTLAENFLSGNPHFAKSALAAFTPHDMVALVERHRIAWHEKTLGQLFCDGSARQIVTLLERECAEAGVKVRCGVAVAQVRTRAEGGYTIEAVGGEFRARTVLVATGGLSIPKLGVSGVGYEIARSFGLRVVEPRPALVPLVFAAADAAWSKLSGVSLEVVAQAESVESKREPRAPEFREKLLITHRGVSGPAVLQVSSYWRPGRAVTVDLAPGVEVLRELRGRAAGRDEAALLTRLRAVWPARFAEQWVAAREERGFSNAAVDRLEAAIHAWTLKPAGDEGFSKAEVTVGGVDTAELDARTLEVKRLPGLYFIGEVVDVTGWLGGYNFQWAWASGAAAGRHC